MPDEPVKLTGASVLPSQLSVGDAISTRWLCLQKVEVVGRAISLAKRKAVTNGLSRIVFRGFNRIGDGFPLGQVGGNGRGQGTAGSVSRIRLNKFPLKHAEKPAVIE